MTEDPRPEGLGGRVEFRHYTYCRPAILILLKEHESHGYELVDRLAELGFDAHDSRDSASIYRMLRAMDKEGLTTSTWDVSKVGPPRRVYAITADGDRYLRGCKGSLVRQRHALDRLLDRYSLVVEDQEQAVRVTRRAAV
jgi:poly-beta-hydroxybutyrate-responsive repressor